MRSPRSGAGGAPAEQAAPRRHAEAGELHPGTDRTLDPGPEGGGARRRRSVRRGGWEWAIVALITVGAAVLRLWQIGKVPPDPFYDAAVRSMTLSWHNFLFGAFEPGASVSIDKPPVDLWLQVVSVKLLGFSSTALKLPEALAGTAAVPLLYEALRRLWSVRAGIAAAAALAVLPVEVITARSDTMDGVMMLLLVIALLLIARAIETGSTGWLLAGAAALGVAFDVKLLESLVALPGLALLAALGLPGSPRRRALQLLAAGALYVVVALAWLTATLLAPANDRPWAIGSTNGSAWNAAFVFNGKDRLSGKGPEPQGTVYEPGHVYPTATQSQRDHIPILPPSATRLLARVGPLSGQRLGMEILIALILGIPALFFGARGPPDRFEREQREQQPDGEAESALRRLRTRRAAAAGLALWMLTGLVLFSHMARLHPRYVEGFTPAVAALLGVGLAWACSSRARVAFAALTVAMLVTIYYAERLLYGTPAVWWVVALAALVAIALGAVATLTGRPGGAGARRAGADAQSARRPAAADRGARAAGGLALLAALTAVLAVGLKADITSIEDRVSDAGFVGQLPADVEAPMSRYLRSHRHGAKYEVAAQSATQIGSLIVRDALPIAVLTTYNARVYTSVPKLKRMIAAGQVRYAYLSTFCSRRHVGATVNAACAEPVLWIREHGTDVSRQAGLPKHKLLYLLPGAKP
ncbi:MAG TPA: glycosyltransferase family 39 protein [Solirubrobacteraceae bacterium]